MKHNILARIQLINTLILKNSTGTPSELAQTIGVSESTIFQYLRIMKKFGAPIAFNFLTKNYYYKADGNFVCFFSFKLNNNNPDPSSRSIVAVKSMKEYLEILTSAPMLNFN